jgi:hypothetical protein
MLHQLKQLFIIESCGRKIAFVELGRTRGEGRGLLRDTIPTFSWRGFSTAVRFLAEVRIFIFVTTSSLICYRHTGNSFPSVKQAKCKADLSPPSGAEVRNLLRYTSTPHPSSPLPYPYHYWIISYIELFLLFSHLK